MGFFLFDAAKGLVRTVLGGKNEPLAVGVVDQFGRVGETGVLLAGAGVFLLLGGVGVGVAWFIIRFANWLF